MGKCKDCDHWNNAMFGDWGTCTLMHSDKDHHPLKPQTLAHSEGALGSVATDPEFGCVMFEAGESGAIPGTDEALKPCPFCGGEATLKESADNPWNDKDWSVSCDNKECLVVSRVTFTITDTAKADAIAAWNRRADDRETIAAAVSAERRRIVAELRRNMAVYEQLEQSAYTRGRNGLYKRYHELKKAWEHAMHIAEHGGSGREETAAAGDAPEGGEP